MKGTIGKNIRVPRVTIDAAYAAFRSKFEAKTTLSTAGGIIASMKRTFLVVSARLKKDNIINTIIGTMS